MLTIYKASAGSGKTFTLAYEYIKLLLGQKRSDGSYTLRRSGNDHHHHILAITFTNKATEEMKRRIIRELALLAGHPLPEGDGNPDEDSPYRPMLLKLYGCSDEDLRQTARRSLLGILHDFTFFNVSTIDSFFQLILRTFAREAELNGNFDIELDDSNAIALGVDRMLMSINRFDDNETRLTSHWIERYMIQQVNEGLSFNFLNRSGSLHDTLINLIKGLNDETFKQQFNAISEYLADHNRLTRFADTTAGRIEAIRTDCTNAALRVLNTAVDLGIDLTSHINKHLHTTLLQWADGKSKAPVATVCAALDEPKKRYRADVFKGKADPINPTLDNLIIEAIATGINAEKQISALSVVTRQIHILGILAPVLRNITEFRNENNLILLSDTNELLRRIISTDEAPFIYERLGMQINHFLIDEFQDTSRLQWENLSPLLVESLSRDNDNLIIGDEKQSIYRFRGGDPELLHSQVAEQFPRQSTIKGNTPSENTNWRSSAEVVRFNNDLFTDLANRLDITDIYNNVAQQVSPKHLDHHGYIKLHRLSCEEDFTNRALDELTADIRRLRLAGYSPADIVILTRGNGEAATVVNHLIANIAGDPTIPPTPILSDEALHINNSKAVRLIISVLRYLDTPDNRSNESNRKIARIINRYEYFHSQGANPEQAIEKALSDETPIDHLAEDAADIVCTSVISIVERIISRFLPDETLSSQAPYLYAFQDLVIEFCTRFAPSVHTFLQWWDRSGHRRSIPAPASSDSLRVMTIHKSKGLEFPCVIIPFAKWTMHKPDETRWYSTDTLAEAFDIDESIIPPIIPVKGNKALLDSPLAEQYNANRREQIIDSLNATYVAFTRAVDVLIAYYPEETKSPDNNIAPLLHQAIGAPESPLFEIGTLPLKEQEETAASAIVAENHPYTTSDNSHIWAQIRIDDLADIESVDDLFNLTYPRVRGTVLHNIMRSIRYPSDLARAIRRQIARGIITDELGEEFSALLSEALADERVAPWYHDFSMLLNERAISIPQGNNPPERYRPDRVVRTADGYIDVIDYKFGEHNDKYISQVRRYVTLLSRQFPADKVRGFLWYPLSATIIPVK